jgi:hypothetical protein
MNDATTDAKTQEFLSIKSGRYNKHRRYNEHGGVLSTDVARSCAGSVGTPRSNQSASHYLCHRL